MIGDLFLSLVMLQITSAGQIEVNAVTCDNANRSFLITCVTFAAVAAIACVLLKWYWDRRLVKSYGFRLAIPLVLAFLISSALVAWYPINDEALSACLESEEFSRYVTMARVAPIPKGLVLGGLISVGIYFLILIIIGLFGKLRKR